MFLGAFFRYLSIPAADIIQKQIEKNQNILSDFIENIPSDFIEKNKNVPDCCVLDENIGVDIWKTGAGGEFWTKGWDNKTFPKNVFRFSPGIINENNEPLITFKKAFNQDTLYLIINSFIPEKWNDHVAFKDFEDIIDSSGWNLFAIQKNSHIYYHIKIQSVDQAWSFLPATLILLSIIFFFAGIHEQSIKFVQQKKYQLGIFLILGTWLVFNIFWAYFSLSSVFSEYFLYSKEIAETGMYVNLGEICQNILLFFFFILFMEKHIPTQSYKHLSNRMRFLLSAMNYSVLLFGLYCLAIFYNSLVKYSDIIFDFENIFNLDIYSVLAIFFINLLILTFFIFSVRVIIILRKLKLPGIIKYLSVFLAFLILLTIVVVQGDLSVFPAFTVGALIYILLLEIFNDAEDKSISWLIVWLVISSAFSTIMLYKFNRDFEYEKKEEMAAVLLEGIDSTLIKDWQIIKSGVLPFLTNQYVECESTENIIFSTISHHLISSEYIADQYNYTFYPPKYLSNNSCNTALGSPKPIKTDLFSFQINMEIPVKNEACNCLLISLQLDKKKFEIRQSNSVANSNFLGLQNLSKYEYAVYSDAALIGSNSNIYALNLPDSLKDITAEKSKIVRNNYEIVLMRSGKNTVIISGKLSGIMKPISLFSYLFVLASIFIIILTAINHKFKFLPEYLGLKLFTTLTLRYRIQFALLSVIIFSFILIAIITTLYFRTSATNTTTSVLRNKAVYLAEEMDKQLQKEQSAILPPEFIAEMDALAQLNDVRINLYDNTGNKLLFGEASHSVIEKLPYGIFQNILTTRESKLYEDENRLEIFVPINYTILTPDYFLKVASNDGPTNYMNNTRLFLSALLNVYVFLLLIASAIAITVANSVSKPIMVLGQKLKEFRLGRRNQTLEWKNKDELGLLINEYNALIEKLEESARLLAQTEREVAWREMAKQIAHEIKNPLTPMKLSIQYLEMAGNSASAEALQKLIKRTSLTLVEQIENLSKIASEFSNFAKLPQPQNELIVLNDLVASVHDLFRKSRDIKFNLFISIDEIIVYADRSHLLRVLNNLLKNAIQAIPAGRPGEITLKLASDGNLAIINVIDNGVGISPEMQKKVFYPNFTTKTSGTGLGLAISKSIIESFGGKIYFETSENKGTNFCFEIPVSKGNI